MDHVHVELGHARGVALVINSNHYMQGQNGHYNFNYNLNISNFGF